MEEFEKHLERILSGAGYQTNEAQKRRLIRTKDPIVIFGAGDAGASCLDKLIDWQCHNRMVFCDNYRSGTKQGLNIIPFDTLLADPQYSHSLIVLAIGTNRSAEIYEQLQKSKIPADRIILRDYVCDKTTAAYLKSNECTLKTLYGKLSDDLSRKVFWKKVENALYCRICMDGAYQAGAAQYFDSCLPLGEDEVFVDGGAFTGDTAAEFIRRVNGRYRHIFELEPEKDNVKVIGKNLQPYRDITIINKGLWDRETTLRFNAGGGAASSVSSSGKVPISVTCIDALLKTGYIPTFIKMDIEGSELMALRGAAQTIRTYRPKLAVCIYHKPTDIVELPKVIDQLNPEYSYCLRHYLPGFSLSETVLYAF